MTRGGATGNAPQSSSRDLGAPPGTGGDAGAYIAGFGGSKPRMEVHGLEVTEWRD